MSNYFKDMEGIQPLVDAEDWDAARTELEAIVANAGYIPGSENAHSLLAYIYRELGETDLERAALEQIATQEGNRIEPVTRLLEIALEQDTPPDVVRWANAWIAIKPIAIEPWRALFTTHARFRYEAEAIATGNVLVELDPPDIAQVHYELARQHQRRSPEVARRHALMSLEEAPRFRLAYQLLDNLNKKRVQTPVSPSAPETLDETIREAIRF